MKIYTFDIEPIGKPRMVRSDKWSERTCVNNYWAYKDSLVSKAISKRYKVGKRLQIEFYLSMPKSWSEKKKAKYDCSPHTQKPDIDNMIKAFLDCLCDNDSFVWDIRASKRWAEKGKIVVKQ